MLDDAGRLGDDLTVVHQRGELGQGPQLVEPGTGVGILKDLVVFERRAVGPQWDQRLPGVRRERVSVEFEAHAPASLTRLACSTSSSLGSTSAKLPLGTS